MPNHYQKILLPDIGRTELVCLGASAQDLAHTLSPAERDVIRKAVEKRRREFATGRWLAHRALAEIGVAVDSIPSGARREPIWPEAVLGSITHTDGQVAVVVTKDPRLAGVGIDLERMGRVDDTILHKVLTERERSKLGSLDPTLLFSAKESCYKVLYPIFREYVDFQEVEVEVDEADGSFSLTYLGDRPDYSRIKWARGNFQKLGDCWLTSVILPSGKDFSTTNDLTLPK